MTKRKKLKFRAPGIPFRKEQTDLLKIMSEVPGAGFDYCDAIINMFVYKTEEKSESYERQKK